MFLNDPCNFFKFFTFFQSPLENRVGLTWRQNNELNVTSTAKRLNKIPEEVQGKKNHISPIKLNY